MVVDVYTWLTYFNRLRHVFFLVFVVSGDVRQGRASSDFIRYTGLPLILTTNETFLQHGFLQLGFLQPGPDISTLGLEFIYYLSSSS